MCASFIAGAVDITDSSNALFKGDTVFAYNMATFGGTNVK